ncbi:hypothetical protein AB4142_22225 [Variovorax sp. 2RAF20]
MRFDDGKTEALNLRVSPSFKAALKQLAETENRSMVNMLEVLVMDRVASSEVRGIDSEPSYQHGKTPKEQA